MANATKRHDVVVCVPFSPSCMLDMHGGNLGIKLTGFWCKPLSARPCSAPCMLDMHGVNLGIELTGFWCK